MINRSFVCRVSMFLFMILSAGMVLGQSGPATPSTSNSSLFRDQVKRMEQGNVDLFMVGDSITLRWLPYPTYPELCGVNVWNKYLKPRNVMNFGVGGECTMHVIWRLQNAPLNRISPKACVALIGTNNLRNENAHKPAEVAEGIDVIVSTLRTAFPKAEILLMEIFPREKMPNAPARIRVNETNAILRAKYGNGKVDHVKLLSIEKQLLQADGVLRQDLLPDFLHPNEAGYTIFAETLEPELTRIFGPLPKAETP